MSVNARFPGSAHDSGIWATSPVRISLKNAYTAANPSILLGDSGYPLEPWMFVPFPIDTQCEVEKHYNKKHKTARNAVERLNGILKSQFRCLHKHRVLNYDPTTASHIINAVCILYNFILAHEQFGDETSADSDDNDESEDESDVSDDSDDSDNEEGGENL